MARLQLLVVASMWLLVIGRVVRARVRRDPHRRWMAALETLRAWDRQVPTGQLRSP